VSASEVLWWIFAALVVGTSLGVVASRSVIHSAIFLILSLAAVAAIYVFLLVEFLALVQVLIYGGAVTVLILLALMLTRQGQPGRPEPLTGPQMPFALVVGGVLAAILIAVAVDTTWPAAAERPSDVGLELISQRLFQDFGAPFIVAGVLLLVALVGAIILARQEEGD
jgi:NADH:ubiquinone oxidoreductase subunit 6 (subunit J)